MKNIWIIGAMLQLFCLGVAAQDYSWWNQIHHWDGHTHWSNYLILSPAYMGPNALPVQPIRQGSPPAHGTVEMGPEVHLGKGDRTLNLVSALYLPLFSKRVGLGLDYVPVEFFWNDTETRDLRFSRDFDGRGYSLGDLYITTYIHLLKEADKKPDLMLTITLKTASGTRLDAARHTDTPGYYFDLSAGKNFHIGTGKISYLRTYAMAGFYAFQTNLEEYKQNDAFTYGAGVAMQWNRLRWEHGLGGYAGYLGNGDKPVVYRSDWVWNTNSPLAWKVRFQQGFNDFPYRSLRLTCIYKFEP